MLSPSWQMTFHLEAGMLAKVRFWNGSPRVRTARIERKEFKLAFFFCFPQGHKGGIRLQKAKLTSRNLASDIRGQEPCGPVDDLSALAVA